MSRVADRAVDQAVDQVAVTAAPGPGPHRSGRRLPETLAGIPPWAGGLVGIVFILVVWELASLSGLAPAGKIPGPFAVIGAFVTALGDPVYWNAIAQTGGAAARGFLYGNVIAVLMAFVVLLLPPTDSLITQIAVVASCVPITAVAPIVTLMSTSGTRTTSVFLAALSVIFTTVVGTILGLRTASATQLDVIRGYGGSRLTELRKVRLIAALPSVLAALKIAAPAAFLGAVLGEYFLIGVDSGLGILLLAAQATSNSLQLWTIALICGGVAGLAYFLIGLLGRLVAPWSAGDARPGGF
jgi:ABC-type nitrate/sulfonate/bicarbonate transport system permease component